MTKTVSDLLAKKGIKFLGWTEVGTADIVGKKPYLVPADVKGLKAASASNKVSAMTWTTLGANPTPIGITEIASAFQTGLTDVNGTVVTFYLPSGLAKVAPVFVPRRAVRRPGHHPHEQGNLRQAACRREDGARQGGVGRSEDPLRKEIRGFEEVLRGMHVKAGGTIATPTPSSASCGARRCSRHGRRWCRSGGDAGLLQGNGAARAACDKKA